MGDDDAGAGKIKEDMKLVESDQSVESQETSGDNRAPAVQAEFDLGPDFEVLELIGRGATGRVFKVKDRKLDRVLAVKVLHRDLIVDSQSVKRFSQEASAADRVAHENIVSVYEHGTTSDGSPYMTMNYIEGESLASILKREGTIEITRALEMFSQLCDGLAHAHDEGLVHRDLKPSNIIVTKTESGAEIPYIVDFGIAKVVSARGDTLNTLTAAGDFIGTPVYMSPEQCLGQAVDLRSDVYALGTMLFEAVSGKPPFFGANSVEIIARKMSEDSPSLASDTISPGLSMIVSCCMARNPRDRYGSVRAIKQDLLRFNDPGFAKKIIGMDSSTAGKRVLAAFLDWVIVSTVAGIFNIGTVVMTVILAAILKQVQSEFVGAWIVGAGYVLTPALVMLAYYAGCEAYRGSTPGKQLLGLKVCDQFGRRLTARKALARNGFKLVILLVIPLSGLIGFALPNSWPGLITLAGSFLASTIIMLRALIVEHQCPWDLWAGTQIRRR